MRITHCLATVDEFKRCGIRKVDITGGEPFIRDDWEKIFDALADARIKIGIIFTNASLLTDRVLDVLEANNRHPTFQLSFDGLGWHDRLRGVDGAEVQAIDGFKLLRDRNFRATASMCVHRLNRHTLRDTANFLASLGVAALMAGTPQELGIWKRYVQEYALTFDEAWQMYREYIPQWYAEGARLTFTWKVFSQADATTRAVTKLLSCKKCPPKPIGRRCPLAAAAVFWTA